MLSHGFVVLAQGACRFLGGGGRGGVDAGGWEGSVNEVWLSAQQQNHQHLQRFLASGCEMTFQSFLVEALWCD